MLLLMHLNSLTPLYFLNLCTGSKSVMCLSYTKFLTLLNLLICKSSVLFYCTRSSSVVTVTQPSSSSSSTNCLFYFYMWNRLPVSFLSASLLSSYPCPYQYMFNVITVTSLFLTTGSNPPLP